MFKVIPPKARRLAIALSGLALLGALGYFVHGLYNFANLFRIFKPHSGIRTTQEEIAIAHNQTTPDPRPQVVPKITHQIFHEWKDPGNFTLPEHWAKARQSCIDLNPDWEHMIWHTESSRAFLVEHFPWYVPTYDGYKFPIQRVDVMRYFLILHYGGIYMDLDNGCAANLDPMTYYPAFTTDGGHGALSNNIIGGQPGHPFFQLLVNTLVPWDWNLILPYVIISWTSGQWFVTAMWERYHALLKPDGTFDDMSGTGWKPLNHIMMDNREGRDPWVFFTQVHGGTWTNWDSHMFDWIGEHILLIAGGVTALVGLNIWACVWCARRRRAQNRNKGYQPVAGEERGPAAGPTEMSQQARD